MIESSGHHLLDSKAEADSPAFSARLSPGGYFYFWNLLVPLSVLLNVLHFGLSIHEAGLILALAIGPHIFEGLVQNMFLLWAVVMFLFIWIERILWRWPCYQIYSCCFASSLLLLFLLVAVPTLLIRWLWYPLYRGIPRSVRYLRPDLSEKTSEDFADALLLIGSVLLLMHSLNYCKPAQEETSC